MTSAVQRSAGMAKISRIAAPLPLRPASAAVGSASQDAAPRPARSSSRPDRTNPTAAVAKAGHMPLGSRRSTM